MYVILVIKQLPKKANKCVTHQKQRNVALARKVCVINRKSVRHQEIKCLLVARKWWVVHRKFMKFIQNQKCKCFYLL